MGGGGGGGEAPKSMTKDEYFKLCTDLVQEQVYTWVIASALFNMILDAPRYGGQSDITFLKIDCLQ